MRTKTTTDRVPSEAQEQKALFEWRDYNIKRYPALELLHAIPNGGSRNPIEGRHLKEQGVMAGIPDICLPVPSRHHTALYIELKRRKGGRVSEAQKKVMFKLRKYGNMAVVAYGFEDAKRIILEYLRQWEGTADDQHDRAERGRTVERWQGQHPRR